MKCVVIAEITISHILLILKIKLEAIMKYLEADGIRIDLAFFVKTEADPRL